LIANSNAWCFRTFICLILIIDPKYKLICFAVDASNQTNNSSFIVVGESEYFFDDNFAGIK